MSNEQRPHLKIVRPQPVSSLRFALDSFIVSREAMRATPATLRFYRQRLGNFMAFLDDQRITQPEHITPHHIRTFIVGLERRNLSDWYIHGHARAVRTFIRFLHDEGIIPDNPMARVVMPRLDKRILPAFAPDDVKRLLDACQSVRDRAIVLALVDTGCRASEFVALNVAHVDIKTGAVKVKQGKGRKDRVTFLGAKARKALLRYFMERGDVRADAPLWLSEMTGERLSTWGLRLMLRRLGQRSGVKHCNPHTFRRTCALWSLRAGMNIYALQQIMGHADLSILRRYLALVEEDLADAHRKHGAVDNML